MDFSEMVIEKLKSEHDLDGFKSYEPELRKFFVEDALDNQRKNISVTYLLFYESNLTGYITLLNDRIDVDKDLKLFLKSQSIHYNSLPAIKIGRLCVDDGFLRKRFGRILISFSIRIARLLS